MRPNSFAEYSDDQLLDMLNDAIGTLARTHSCYGPKAQSTGLWLQAQEQFYAIRWVLNART